MINTPFFSKIPSAAATEGSRTNGLGWPGNRGFALSGKNVARIAPVECYGTFSIFIISKMHKIVKSFLKVLIRFRQNFPFLVCVPYPFSLRKKNRTVKFACFLPQNSIYTPPQLL
ncbi:MAG: hypothetical protein LUD84_09180 [Clostridiales bacterium]|nr:hypothetical protein [Clostridiales bacterium]